LTQGIPDVLPPTESETRLL